MIIVQTPLRISIVGGNTDFPKYFKKHGGMVITTTIDKYIYCIVTKRFDKQIWINYSKKEVVNKVKDIKHDIVREALKLVGIEDSIEITFLSDIPSQGSGLGSSSAVAIAVLHALHVLKKEKVTNRQLAEEACKIEVDILKKPIGYQDQYAIAFGGLNLIKFGNKIKVFELKDSYRDTLMLFYTGKTRKSEDILKKMKLDKKILDKNKKIVQQALRGKEIFKCLNEYWKLKNMLNSAVSTTAIDAMYERAMYLGALGGKIVGAGGGGFLLLVALKENQPLLRKYLGLQELRFKYSTGGSKVIFNI